MKPGANPAALHLTASIVMVFVDRWRGLSAEQRAEIRRELNIPNAVVEHVSEHVKLKAMLQDHINGTEHQQLDADAILRNDRCALGRWIHGGGGAILGNLPALHAVRANHAQFHFLASRVVRRVRAGDHLSAQAILNNDFEGMSNKVVQALLDLNELVEGVAFNPSPDGRGRS